MLSVLTLIIGLLTGYLIHIEVSEYKTKKEFENVVKKIIKNKKESSD